ncbi:MAG: hypothetical protein JWP87_2628 [Labilithrix sp.]|nr:hypothetical protein [Labilithrix sp.]
MRARPRLLLSLGLVVSSLSGMALLLDGCGSSSNDATIDDAATADSAAPLSDSGSEGSRETGSPNDGATGCVRTIAAADRPRKVVVSHPFVASGMKGKEYEVLDLAVDGTLTRPTTPVTFAMGTALNAPIVFTPDGEVGLVAQDDGSIGVFRLPANGAPAVVHAAFQGGFYAGGIVLAPDGSHAWVLDSNTGPNGGGVYEVVIACDGTLMSRGLVIPGGGATAMALLPTDPTKALLAARKAFQSPANTDVHLVDLAAHTLIGSAAAFGDTDAIVSSVAIMPDGKYALVADDGVTVGSRMAVMSLVPAVAPVAVLPTPYPAAVVASPFGNAAIVLNDDSTDEIHTLSYDATKPAAPFVITGELAYAFPKPQIPVTAALIDRGALRGTVLIGENVGVRRVVFAASGAVTDAQKLSFPDGIPNVVGVVGVQP